MNSYNGANTATGGASSVAVGIFILMYFVVILAVALVTIIGTWRVYQKAGKPGWAALIPIYNNIVWCDIVGRPLWWVVLLFIPGVNAVIAVILALDLAKSYGKDDVYGILICLFPFVMLPVLGFSDAAYVGPSARGGTTAVPAPVGASPTGQPVPPVAPAPIAPVPPAPITPVAPVDPAVPVAPPTSDQPQPPAEPPKA